MGKKKRMLILFRLITNSGKIKMRLCFCKIYLDLF
jgi:hypothetical protein